MKPYQLEGLSFLVYLRNNGVGGILGDEMGLGKTIQTLALFQYVKETEGPQSAPSLVVCPMSVLDTWTTEVAKWTPHLKLVKLHGSVEQRGSTKALINKAKKVLPLISGISICQANMKRKTMLIKLLIF